MAFDHDVILRDGVELVRDQIQHFPHAIVLCANEFTLRQLRAIYEAIWGVRLNPRSFRREALNAEDFLRPTDRHHLGMGRPARLYTPGDADFLRPPLRRPKPSISAPERS